MAIKTPPPAPKKPGAKKTAPGKTLAKVEEKTTALATVDVNTMMQDAANARGTFGKDDLMISFLRVLQELSPQKQKQHEKYVEGAEVGMFILTSTNELWSGEDGVIVIPIHYTPSYIEWKTRESGGGFVKDHGPTAPDISTVRDDKNREILPNGNQLVKSGLYFIYIVDEETGAVQEAAFPLQGTQLKKSRQWNTRMQTLKVDNGNGGTFVPAPFYMTYKITTVFEQNDQGNWFGVVIEPYKPVIELKHGSGTYLQAREYKDLIAAGRVKTQPLEVEAEVIQDGDKSASDAY